ncbi:MAG: serine/threonine protein kinase [Acidobacteria bacterium]|nr:serine/threonine protein kinase [Acidobacteriota bacterium]
MSGPIDLTRPPSGPSSASEPAGAAFTPGHVVAGRYRLAGLLGRGGMGDVYRADDLTLGMPVAVKFLPPGVDRDSVAFGRFRDEVRLARRVSHPHVCRVFDIGEVDGRHFLTMEFVDGEDLATLLRRIGRLPLIKALELGRQVCQGLSAAHHQGVLHRDLKPANVMVDGHGRARIADFGLAVSAASTVRELAGTPAYMAPELLCGELASVHSDIYALGLVLYEMVTGRQAFDASSLDEWRRVHAEAVAPPPRTYVADLDPGLDALILQCLAKDPTHRPSSAGDVALALSGGDPFALLAPGETPSPAMVAAANGAQTSRPAAAWARAGAVVAAVVALVAMAPYSADFGLAPMTKSPDVLRDRAIEMARLAGYTAAAVDDAWWLERDYALLAWMANTLPSTDRAAQLQALGAPVLLTYRRAHQTLVPTSEGWLLTPDAPPLPPGSGDLRVVVDGAARLREFSAAAVPDPSHEAGVVDEDLVFRLADLDRSLFVAAAPSALPPTAFDTRRAWTGPSRAVPALPLTVQSAWLDGRLVWADIRGPWQGSAAAAVAAASGSRLSVMSFTAFVVIVLAVFVELGRRNLRAGRGDRRGAFRIACVAGVSSAVAPLFATHLDGLVVLRLVFGTFDRALGSGGVAWLAYIALEPLVRRQAPRLLVGWARLLEGRVNDPAVARDVLLGLVTGAWCAVLLHLLNMLPTFILLRGQTPVPGFSYVSRGSELLVRIEPAAAIVGALDGGLMRALFLFMAVALLRRLLGPRLAVVAAIGFLTVAAVGGENPLLDFPSAVVVTAALVWLASAHGLLALVAAMTVNGLLGQSVTASMEPAWYSTTAWGVILGVVALAIWAARLSQQPQSRPIIPSSPVVNHGT